MSAISYFLKFQRVVFAGMRLVLALFFLAANCVYSQEPDTTQPAAEQKSFDSPSQGFLPVNGFAKYAEFDKDLYIGALFLARPATDPGIIKSMQAKRIEFKVAHERLAYKRFGQLLIKSSAINNPPKMLVENARAMERFLKVFRDNLVRGDHIVLANKTQGFSVSLNGVELAEVDSPDLFNMLLNIWIGDVPPSRDFRGRILGNEQALEFASEFANLEYSSARVAEISRWKTPNEIAVADESSVESDSAVIAAPSVLADTTPSKIKPSAPAVQIAKTTQVSSSPAKEKTAVKIAKDRSNESVAPAPKKENKSVSEPAKNQDALITAVSISDSEPEVKQVTTALLNTAPAAKPSQTRKIADDIPEDNSFSAENLLAVQLYVSKLLIHSQSQMRYPTIARRLGHQGKVVVSVTVDRKGKLKDYEITDESDNKSLNVAVTKGIKRSEPFPAVPASIEGEDFTFSVPVNFRISG